MIRRKEGARKRDGPSYRPREEDLEGEESPGRRGRTVPATELTRYGPVRGATPRSRNPGKPGRNGRTASVAATRHGCGRGVSFEGCARCGEILLRPDSSSGGTRTETQRTPGSAAGCNKPANLEREQAVGAVRNREDGTRRTGPAARFPMRDSGNGVLREWTLEVTSMEGQQDRSRNSRGSLAEALKKAHAKGRSGKPRGAGR
jgi:hypothetical protein